MILYQGQKRDVVNTLLDTGCAIALINQETVKRLGIQ